MSIPTDHGVIDKRPLREKLLADMDAFLKRGGKVDELGSNERTGDTVNQYAERNRKRARVLKNNSGLFGFREAQ